jgi:glycosyltransferase involved in cell wall biosynthesis
VTPGAGDRPVASPDVTPGAGDRPGGTDAVVPLLLGSEWWSDQPGGLPRYLAELFGALRGIGLRPRATVAGPALDAPVGVSAGGHFARFFPVRLGKFALAAARSARGVDVVDAHFAFYAFLPVVLGPLRRLPLVVHFQGPWAQESRVEGDGSRLRLAVKRGVEGAVYRRAGSVVVLSDAFKRVLVEHYGVAPWLVTVVAPGVDLERFAPGDRLAARHRLGLAPEAAVVVAVRRLVPRTGVDVLVEAWAKVAPMATGAVLLIVGDGPERDGLGALARRLGVAGSVRFLGGVDDATVVDCYRAGDLSVVPSLALEGFGLVVTESLACGTPAIVSDAGGLPEAVRGLDPSVVVAAGDRDALAARLAGALDGTDPLPDRDRCRSHATAFGWPAVARRHRDIYAAAARPGGPRKLRVVYVDHCAQLSGGELALLRLLPALVDVDAHVILGEHGPLVDRLRQAGVSVEVMELAAATRGLHRDRVQPGRLPVAATLHAAVATVRLAARLRRLRPDIVHTNSLKAALYGGVAGRLASVPVVWHIRDRIADDYLPPAARRLVHAAGRFLPSAVVANSAATLATLGAHMPPAAVIPSPVSPAGPARPPRGDGRPLRVGIVGRLAPWKGQGLFLDAFAAAFPDGPEVAVVVGAALFGEDGHQGELEARAERLGLGARVEFRGFRHDVAGELARLDVLVHASTIPEPFGQVVVEGMAAGLAVVAADAGGPAEVVTDGVDGLLYPMGDAEALAARLRRLAADPAWRRRLGARARVTGADYTAERIAPRVMAAYRALPGAADQVEALN